MRARGRQILFWIALLAGLTTACGRDVEVAAPAPKSVAEESPQPAAEREGLPVVAPQPIPTAAPASPTPAPTPQPTPQVITFTLSAAGDCSLGNYQDQDYAYSFRQTYEQVQDPGYFFQNVHEIFAADDMTLVNFEGVLTFSEMRQDRTYNIKGDPSYTDILTAGSVEAVSMGNNHRLDYGQGGSDDTVAAMQEAGIVYAYDDHVGIYESPQGIRVGYVSVNEVSWGEGCEKFIREGFEKLREEGADLLLACCHWGVERDYQPEAYQRKLGKLCIDLGADLVIGHHPHVLQGIEEYQGKYIIYSLGNFCFGANRNPSDKDTMIFQQTFTFVDGVKQEETAARVIPCSLSSVKERNNYQPTPAQGDEAARILERLRGFSRDFGVDYGEDGTLIIKQ